jgi:hypothetical protein
VTGPANETVNDEWTPDQREISWIKRTLTFRGTPELELQNVTKNPDKAPGQSRYRAAIVRVA